MAKLIKKISKAGGHVPGALIHIGEKNTEKVKISIIDYDADNFQEKEAKTVEESYSFKETPTITWINVDGVHSLELIEKIGKHFDVHQLFLEDIVNTGQRPKYEDAEKYIFVSLKMLYFEQNEIKAEQISLVLGPNFVISFQEKEGDVFGPIRERIRSSKGRIRKMGADYLAYSLIDALVDNYFIILEKMGEKIDAMEEELIKNPSQQILRAIQNLKRDAIFLRKSVWPLREVISGIERGESKLIKKTTHIFLRDVYEHTIQVIDTIETFRDMASGILDIYLSSISNKMNEVMKVLTIFAAIFIPLTFVAGIYGMNFQYMPELAWKWGYFGALGVMGIIGISLAAYFKKKNWM